MAWEEPRKRSLRQLIESLNSDEIDNAFDIQTNPNKKSKGSYTGWTFYEERQLIENVLQTRFNFLITVYALILTAFATSKTFALKLGILCVGLVLIIFLGMTVHRIAQKMEFIFRLLLKLKDKHAPEFIERRIWLLKCTCRHSNLLIGTVVPLFFVLSLIAGLVLTILHVFDTPVPVISQ